MVIFHSYVNVYQRVPHVQSSPRTIELFACLAQWFSCLDLTVSCCRKLMTNKMQWIMLSMSCWLQECPPRHCDTFLVRVLTLSTRHMPRSQLRQFYWYPLNWDRWQIVPRFVCEFEDNCFIFLMLRTQWLFSSPISSYYLFWGGLFHFTSSTRYLVFAVLWRKLVHCSASGHRNFVPVDFIGHNCHNLSEGGRCSEVRSKHILEAVILGRQRSTH